MNQENQAVSRTRVIILYAVALVCGTLLSRFFILPELEVFIGLFSLVVFVGAQGVLFTTRSPLYSFIVPLLCLINAFFTGKDRLFMLIGTAFAILAAAVLALSSARHTPRHVLFTELCVLFCLHILTVLALVITERYGSFSIVNIKTAVDDLISTVVSPIKEAAEKAASDAMFENLPMRVDPDALVENFSYSLRANLIGMLCVLGMLPAAVCTCFYSLAARFLGSDTVEQCTKEREWLFIPPHALAHFFYIVYFGYIVCILIKNDTLLAAFAGLELILSLPLAYVGLRFLYWLLCSKLHSHALARLIVIGGTAVTALFILGPDLSRVIAALFGAFVTLRTKITTIDRQGGNE